MGEPINFLKLRDYKASLAKYGNVDKRLNTDGQALRGDERPYLIMHANANRSVTLTIVRSSDTSAIQLVEDFYLGLAQPVQRRLMAYSASPNSFDDLPDFVDNASAKIRRQYKLAYGEQIGQLPLEELILCEELSNHATKKTASN